MSDTDYTKLFTDVWTKAGGTLTAAQAQLFKDMSERMGKAFMLPLQAMNPAAANLSEAGEKFRELLIIHETFASANSGSCKKCGI